MPTKESWVGWKEDNYVAGIKLNGDKLVELDRDVNIEEGTILELSFIPPPDEDPKKVRNLKALYLKKFNLFIEWRG